MSRRRNCCCSGSRTGSGGGSGASGSIPVGLHTCCEDVLGLASGTGWPATLTLTITGACCSNMNGSYTLNRQPAQTRFIGTTSIRDCTGTLRVIIFNLTCESGQWNLGVTLQLGASEDVWNCTGSKSHDLTLLSCDPFHFEPFTINVCTGHLGLFCDGALTFEITE